VAREYFPDAIESDIEELAASLVRLDEVGPVLKWKAPACISAWETLLGDHPDRDVQGSWVQGALKIIREGLDVGVTDRPDTRPYELPVDIRVRIAEVNEVIKLIKMGFIGGNVRLRPGETLSLYNEAGGTRSGVYSPILSVDKTDGTRRVLLHQSCSQEVDGVRKESVNGHIFDTYVELPAFADWAELMAEADVAYGIDISKFFYRVPLNVNRSQYCCFTLCGFHFVFFVGVMGSAEAPLGAGTLLYGALEGLVYHYPHLMVSSQGTRRFKFHVDDGALVKFL